ncbi:hypothetical protein DOS77_11795 [Staphylococcus felis]|uniref:Uncharacterized protein n=1 Tax=Staphylococcus felis TaxID=46127 RepID=A0ABS0QKL2_9STAP|nr:hypothetical protein [Staphylococcus felis]MBH9579764.1 hypothetical protein [Staphylococcus felis]REI19595.1 hypothetical protein DOS77_11795 [Staphylococcus felis]
MNFNDDLNEIFLKDIAYNFMRSQIEKDPQTQKMITIFERHGIGKEKAIAILMDMANDDDSQGNQNDFEFLIKQLDSKLQRVFNRVEQVDNKAERIINKLNDGGQSE